MLIGLVGMQCARKGGQDGSAINGRVCHALPVALTVCLGLCELLPRDAGARDAKARAGACLSVEEPDEDKEEADKYGRRSGVFVG